MLGLSPEDPADNRTAKHAVRMTLNVNRFRKRVDFERLFMILSFRNPSRFRPHLQLKNPPGNNFIMQDIESFERLSV